MRCGANQRDRFTINVFSQSFCRVLRFFTFFADFLRPSGGFLQTFAGFCREWGQGCGVFRLVQARRQPRRTRRVTPRGVCGGVTRYFGLTRGGVCKIPQNSTGFCRFLQVFVGCPPPDFAIFLQIFAGSRQRKVGWGESWLVEKLAGVEWVGEKLVGEKLVGKKWLG